MLRPRATIVVILVAGLGVIAPLVVAQEKVQSEREAMYYRYLEFPSYVKGGSIQAHWLADGSSFWYAEGAPDNTIIWKVDPNKNTKTPLFDTARLRQALTPLFGHELPYEAVPFAEFEFLDGEKAVKFTAEGKEFILQLDTYAIAQAPIASKDKKNRLVPRHFPEPLHWATETLSPDGRWFLGVKDYNLCLRAATDDRCLSFTSDGIQDDEWGVRGAQWTFKEQIEWAWWSPDSSKVAVKRRDYRKIFKIPLVHWLKPNDDMVEWVRYGWPGQAIAQTEIFIVHIPSKKLVRISTGDEPDQQFYVIGWRPDGSELLFLRIDREYKRLDLMAASPRSGSTRVILTETAETFVIPWGFEPFIEQKLFTMLDDGRRFLWVSERDGWKHLYLYDMDGDLIRRLTEGTWPVMRVVAVKEKERWVYFTAHGDQQRPYDTHLYRVSLDGIGLTRLTEATGRHEIHFSPSKQFFLDTHSTVARPPTVELRRADGTLLQTLSKANIEALKDLQWHPPKEFVVKAADGKTDLWGVLYKPYDFDPTKKYPVIEVIYGGPQFSEVPHSFTHPHGVDFHAEHGQALAQLGFVVFVVDGRGTPERGKAFQDVVYGNFGRHEIRDHMAALRGLAQERKYMDLRRVGILGWSFGGYFTVRALLLAPDVYHVGIAGGSGGEPSDLDHIVYMGLPENNPEGYEYASNRRLAGNLQGKLLLIVGTSDANAFMPTMKLVDAFIQAGKPHDLIILPEQGHRLTGAARTYVFEAVRRYFQQHLKP